VTATTGTSISAQSAFTVDRLPRSISVDPTSAEAGDQVIVRGTNFQGQTYVYIGGRIGPYTTADISLVSGPVSADGSFELAFTVPNNPGWSNTVVTVVAWLSPGLYYAYANLTLPPVVAPAPLVPCGGVPSPPC
jgi:hypothetical protein